MGTWETVEITRTDKYKHVNCSSLFGYGDKVHLRHGYRCQLCGCGGLPIDFDLWRQMTVEHLIGESQGGYPKQIRPTVQARFPELSHAEQELLVDAIDQANTVTACQFCNSTTTGTRHEFSMSALIADTPGDAAAVLQWITSDLASVHARKRQDVAWKLRSVRAAFDGGPGAIINRGE